MRNRTSDKRNALARVISPARYSILLARSLQVIASIATMVPFVVIVDIAQKQLSGETNSSNNLALAVIVIIGAIFVKAITGQAAYAVSHFADLRVQRRTRQEIAQHLAVIPLGWFTENSSGTVRSAVQDDIEDVHGYLAHGTVETTAAIATPIAALAYLMYLNLPLAAIALLIALMQLMFQLFLMKNAGNGTGNLWKAMGTLGTAIVELVNGIAVVKMYGQEGAAYRRYRSAADGFSEAYSAAVSAQTRRSALINAVFSAPSTILIMLLVGSAGVIVGWNDTVEAITAAAVAATIPPVFIATALGRQSRSKAESASQRIVNLLDAPILKETQRPEVPADGTVQFESVSFGFQPDHPVLSEIDLNCPEGTLTALVGPSGAGKSTLAEMIARFYDPDEGRVTLGGVDLRKISSENLHRHVAIVLQDAQLVRLSVLENIKLSCPSASDEDARNAAEQAQIAREIEELPEGYDTVIGEDAELSTGQRQRIAIARALLGGPRVVILDEATASADPHSEAAVQRALGKLLRGRTVIVIAHRLETIVEADQIAVLDQGRIIELGRHDELLQAAGRYAAMWHAGNSTVHQPATNVGEKI